jgi:hypothetical protein
MQITYMGTTVTALAVALVGDRVQDFVNGRRERKSVVQSRTIDATKSMAEIVYKARVHNQELAVDPDWIRVTNESKGHVYLILSTIRRMDKDYCKILELSQEQLISIARFIQYVKDRERIPEVQVEKFLDATNSLHALIFKRSKKFQRKVDGLLAEQLASVEASTTANS